MRFVRNHTPVRYQSQMIVSVFSSTTDQIRICKLERINYSSCITEEKKWFCKVWTFLSFVYAFEWLTSIKDGMLTLLWCRSLFYYMFSRLLKSSFFLSFFLAFSLSLSITIILCLFLFINFARLDLILWIIPRCSLKKSCCNEGRRKRSW